MRESREHAQAHMACRLAAVTSESYVMKRENIRVRSGFCESYKPERQGGACAARERNYTIAPSFCFRPANNNLAFGYRSGIPNEA
jgi:hypothetical protein